MAFNLNLEGWAERKGRGIPNLGQTGRRSPPSLSSGRGQAPFSPPHFIGLRTRLGFPVLTSAGNDLSVVERAGVGRRCPPDGAGRAAANGCGRRLPHLSSRYERRIRARFPQSWSRGGAIASYGAVWTPGDLSLLPAAAPPAKHDMNPAGWTRRRTDMLPEIAAAVGFLSSLLRTRGCVSEQRLKVFSGALQEALTGEPTPRGAPRTPPLRLGSLP